MILPILGINNLKRFTKAYSNFAKFLNFCALEGTVNSVLKTIENQIMYSMAESSSLNL